MKYTMDEMLNLVNTVFQREFPKMIEQERQAWEKENAESMDMEMGSCFECGSSSQCHRHHIIPQSLGGRSTVLLCESCHGRVHGLNLVNHGVLVRAALEKARRSGKKLGRKVGSCVPTEKFLEKHKRVVQCLHKGGSVRKTAEICGCSKGTVERVKKAMESPEPEFE